MIVADANVIVYLVRETSFTSLARAAYAADPDWVVPPLWKPEVLNVLLLEARAGHVTLNGAIEAAQIAARLLADRVRDCDPAATLRTAEEAGLTAYDASYVALARGLGVLLVTEDKRILRSCPDTARSLKAFLARAGGSPAVGERVAAYRTRHQRGARQT